MSRRTDRHFRSFVFALVDGDQDDFAVMLDVDWANEFIAARNMSREGHADGQGSHY